MDNYPDGMDWGAYDDYHDPKLLCGHRSSDSCDCWCEHGYNGHQHLVDACTAENCKMCACAECGEGVSEEQVEKAWDEEKQQTCKECEEYAKENL